MARPRVSESERKNNFNIRIQQRLIDDIRKIPNYTVKVESKLQELVDEYKDKK